MTDRRSSWVRRLRVGTTDLYLKTYDYPTGRDRRRGALRNTFLAPSRGAREWSALSWLREAGFAAPRPVAVLETRRWGWLRRAVLITEAWPGRPIDQVLAELSADRRAALRGAVVAFVQALHRRGFRDGNMDPRNVLAQQSGTGDWLLAKIDSPRFRLVPPGRDNDRWARRDWQRLAPVLADQPQPW